MKINIISTLPSVMAVYQLIKGGEMLKQSAKCAIDHCKVLKPDSLNHHFVLLECQGCGDRNFCLRIKRVLEEELNK